QTSGDIWHMPIYTVSLSESGFEKVYQGTTFINRYRLTLTDKPVVLLFSLFACSVKDIARLLKPLKVVKS
ncbi:MAG: alpha-amylase/4-alpha-glucanotransferase domain-containing protein, partial [Candidatus Zixiibacteriota bacterium]